MNCHQIKCFLALAETLNFSRCAEQLYMSQPTVTYQVQSLEKELGVKLFNRSKQGVTLTDIGAALKNDFAALHGSIQTVVYKAQNYQLSQETSVEIGWCGSINVHFLPDLLNRYHERYPHIKLGLGNMPLSELSDAFQAHKLDLVFGSEQSISALPDAETYVMSRNSYVCVVSNRHRLHNRLAVSLQSLQEEHWLLPTISSCVPESSKLITLQRQQFPDTQLTVCTSPAAAQMMATAGLGVAILPQFLAVPDQNCKLIPISNELSLNMMLAWHKDDLSLPVRQLVAMAQQMNQIPDVVALDSIVK